MLAGGTHKDANLAVMTSVDQCVDCPEGTSCSVGSAEARPCAPGTVNPSPKAEVCVNCVAGKFQKTAGQTECDECISGYYCAAGAAAALPCPGGTHKNASLDVMTSVDQCVTCPEGTSCSVGSALATPCAPGTYTDEPQQETCKKCVAGQFQDIAGNTACKQCLDGHYCAEGAAAALPCPGGRHADQDIIASVGYLRGLDECIICPPGTSCSVGSGTPSPCLPGSYSAEEAAAVCDLCPEGKFTSTSGNTACGACTDGYLCVEGSSAPQPCRGGTHANQTVLTTIGYLSSLDQCVVCPEGTSCSVGSAEPKPCLPGSFAASAETASCDLCPAGEFQNQYGKTSCKECTRGFFCAQGAATPVPCPGGTSSNASGVKEKQSCVPVGLGFWAPLGSAIPEPCPASGFYCPGAAEDTVNAAPGSKPIIVPVGDSTQTKEVESVQKEMSLDVSCDAFNYDAVKKSLAEQYGCDPALISFPNPCGAARRRALAALTFTITIATEGTAADGTPVTAAVGELLTAVQAVDDTALAGSLGTALGTTVTVSTQPPAQATVEKTVKFTCPKGKWCTAGLIVDCTAGTYNPLEGSDLGTACVPCPEFSTSPIASTSVDDCICQDGFIQSVLADGTARCECDAGKEIMNGVRCDSCTSGTYKPLPGNSKCTDCRSSPLELAAKEFTTTREPGAKLATDCVCKAGYYLVADPITGIESCRPCSATWYQGREGTDCSTPGISLKNLPVLPGFFRQSLTAQVVRKCINIDADAACLGSGNTTATGEVVQTSLFLDIDIDSYDEDLVRSKLALVYNVGAEHIVLSVGAGSLQLTVTIKTSSTGSAAGGANGTAPTTPLLTTAEAKSRIAAVDAAVLASSLGAALGSDSLGVNVVVPAQEVTVPLFTLAQTASSCAFGYSGPYCAVCDIGFFGGGEGGTCAACSDAGDPTLTIAIQGGVFFGVLVFVTLVMLKFGRKALTTAATTLDNAGGDGVLAAAQEDLEGKATEMGEKKPKARLLVRLGGFVTSFGVKMKILVSLYQVLNGLGVIFSIPYPDNYTELLASISAIELDMPSLLPIDCLLGGINFTHTLILQTAGPLFVISVLEFAAKVLRKASAKASKRAHETGGPVPVGGFVAELCSNVSFFLLFLLYPGSSTKIL